MAWWFWANWITAQMNIRYGAGRGDDSGRKCGGGGDSSPSRTRSVAPRAARVPLPAKRCTAWRRCSGTKTTCSSTSGATSRCSRAEEYARTTRMHARARTHAGDGARRCGGRTGTQCEKTSQSGDPNTARVAKKGGRWVFPRAARGADGMCKRVPACEHGDVPLRRDRESNARSVTDFQPRGQPRGLHHGARRAAWGSGAPQRVPTALAGFAMRPCAFLAGARARRCCSDGHGFRRHAPQVLLLSLSPGASKCTS